jgi:hypothetical protein
LTKLTRAFRNLTIAPKNLRLAITGLFLYLSTKNLASGVFISARVSEFLAVFLTPFTWVSAIIEMAGVKEQRTCTKFCFKLNKTAAETHRMLKEVSGEQALSQARTFEWFKIFKDGRESVEADKHSGRPSTCTTPEMIGYVREVILEDRGTDCP